MAHRRTALVLSTVLLSTPAFLAGAPTATAAATALPNRATVTPNRATALPNRATVTPNRATALPNRATVTPNLRTVSDDAAGLPGIGPKLMQLMQHVQTRAATVATSPLEAAPASWGGEGGDRFREAVRAWDQACSELQAILGELRGELTRADTISA